jgi:hypothetical protein
VTTTQEALTSIVLEAWRAAVYASKTNLEASQFVADQVIAAGWKPPASEDESPEAENVDPDGKEVAAKKAAFDEYLNLVPDLTPSERVDRVNAFAAGWDMAKRHAAQNALPTITGDSQIGDLMKHVTAWKEAGMTPESAAYVFDRVFWDTPDQNIWSVIDLSRALTHGHRTLINEAFRPYGMPRSMTPVDTTVLRVLLWAAQQRLLPEIGMAPDPALKYLLLHRSVSGWEVVK